MQDNRTGKLLLVDDLRQETLDKAIPREYQGPTFTVGEVVELKGGFFRITGISSRGRLFLKGVPKP